MIEQMGKCTNVKKDKKQKVLSKSKSSYRPAIVTIILVIYGFILVQEFCMNQAENIYKEDLSSKVTVIINNREYSGELSEIMLKQKFKKGDKITLIFDAPTENKIINPVLQMSCPNNPLKIYLEDEEIYSIGQNKKQGDIICKSVIKIPLMDNYAGKKIRLEINVFDTSAMPNFTKLVLINTMDSDREFLCENAISLFAGIFMIGIGVIGLLFILFTFSKQQEIQREMILSIMSISGGMWILSCYSIFKYWSHNEILLYYLEYESLFLMILLLTIYTYQSMKDQRGKKIIRIFVELFLTYILVANILRACKLIYFQQVLSILHIFIVLALLTATYLSIKNKKENNQLYQMVLLIVMILSLAYGISYIFIISIRKYLLSMVSLAVVVMDIYLFAEYFIEIAKAYINTAERESLLKMAYVDTLTGISNRRACEKYMQEIDSDEENEYVIYSFDIDGLKKINDKYGHRAGDDLIKSFANVLKRVYSDNEGFYGRMGGDEFFAAHKNESEQLQREIINKLEEFVSITNDNWNKEFVLSYSVGYSKCDRKKGLTAWITYNIADNNMYETKSKKNKLDSE